MSLADRLATWEPVARNQCRTCAWYATQTDEDKDAYRQFLKLIDDGQVARAQVLRVFQEEGLDCTESSFNRHLNTCRESH